MTQAADGWIEWAGGGLPVPWDARIDVRLRSGQQLDNCFATTEAWQHVGSPSDIVGYRLRGSLNVPTAPVVEEHEKTTAQRLDELFEIFERGTDRVIASLDVLAQRLDALSPVVDVRHSISAQPHVEIPAPSVAPLFRKSDAAFDASAKKWIIFKGSGIRPLGENTKNESAPEIRPSEKVEVQSDFAKLAAQICTALTVHAFENDEAVDRLLQSHVSLIEGLIASTLRRATLSRYDNNGRFMGDVMTVFVNIDRDQVRRARQSEVDPERVFERAYDEVAGIHRPENESAAETQGEPKVKRRSDFEDMAGAGMVEMAEIARIVSEWRHGPMLSLEALKQIAALASTRGEPGR